MASACNFKAPNGEPSDLGIALEQRFGPAETVQIMKVINSEEALQKFDWVNNTEFTTEKGELQVDKAVELYNQVANKALGSKFSDSAIDKSLSWEYTPDIIKVLKPNEVFVFGANTVGGHGGGTAGLALRGNSKPNYTALPVGTKGKWAEYGVVDKLMQGSDGKSFGIVTKAATMTGSSLKIGSKRSVSLNRISESIDALIKSAQDNPNLKYLVTKFGTNMAGFTIEEIKNVLSAKELPVNIVLPKEFEFRNTVAEVKPTPAVSDAAATIKSSYSRRENCSGG